MGKDTRDKRRKDAPSEDTLVGVMSVMAGRGGLHREDRRRVEKAFSLAERLKTEAEAEGETISDRDVAGYAISRLATDLRARLTTREVQAARLSALGLGLLVRPDAMLRAGLALSVAAPVREALLHADSEYMGWHREVSQPLRDMVPVPGFRAGALRVFERLDKYDRHVLAAEYEKISALVRARGRECTAEDIEGVLLAKVEERGPEGTVRELKSGGIRLVERRCRDLIEAEFPPSPEGGTGAAKEGDELPADVVQLLKGLDPEGLYMIEAESRSRTEEPPKPEEPEPAPASSPDLVLERLEIMDRLVEQLDEIDRFILRRWGDANAEIGRDLGGRSGQGIGERRKGIRERAKRLGLALP